MSELHSDDITWDTNTVPEAEPVPETPPPTLAELLPALETFIRRYVVLNDDQALAVALWTVHTHGIEAFEATPYLQLISATPGAGKTRLLEVLEQLVPRPCLTGRITAAALSRKVDAERPTLLLDESDATFNGPQESSEALRGLLNSGYRRSGTATVCVGQGAAMTTKDFRTFCAKVIAGIGKLPDTVRDRCIQITMRRRAKTEPLQKWRDRDGRQAAAPIHQALAGWALDAIAPLRDARPEMPHALGDRAQDVWEPLLAIADIAGGDWRIRARRAALALSGAVDVDDSAPAIQLLADVRDIFDDNETLTTHDLTERLAALDDRPWATWSKGQKITGHALARLLRPFGVSPGGVIRFGDKVSRAYRRASFVDAWARYLPDVPDGATITEDGDVEFR